MQQREIDAVGFGVGDLLPFRFLEVVEGFYFFSGQGAVVDADVVDGTLKVERRGITAFPYIFFAGLK